MAEKTYWLGKGQVNIAGKLYKHGEEIPADKVSEKKLKEWKRDGDIGTAPFHHKAGRPDNDMKLLQEKLKDAETEIVELKSAAEKVLPLLAEKDEIISGLESQLTKSKDKKK